MEKIRINIFLLLFTVVIFNSCSQKNELNIDGKETVVKFRLSQAMLEDVDIGKKTAQVNNSNKNYQFGYIPNTNITYELVEDNDVNHSASDKLKTNSNLKASSTPTLLTPNVKYRVLAYDSNGLLKGNKEYEYGNEAVVGGMALNAEESYTFIVYSVNSTTVLPSPTDASSLVTVKLEGVDQDLMYYRTLSPITLVYGENFLDIILKHQFTSITTIFTLDGNSVPGTFQLIDDVKFNDLSSSASIQLNTGSITYSSVKKDVEALFSGYANQTSASSTPTLLINDLASNIQLTLGNISISGDTPQLGKTIQGINLKPGKKYKLYINFKTCTETFGVPGNINWSYPAGAQTPGSLIKEDLGYVAGADYGYSLDIYMLDNSVNLKINGVKISNDDIEFDIAPFYGTQNIRFVDGNRYNFNANPVGSPNSNGSTNTFNIPPVYGMNGSPGSPTVKIKVFPDGSVKMYGTKALGGPLFELELFDNSAYPVYDANHPPATRSFNQVVWNKPPLTNHVEVEQRVDGPMALRADGIGVRKINCTP